MSAGLPGLGLGGIFFILSATIAAPVVELARTMRGRSSAAAWLGVGRQFALAVAMIAAIDATLHGVYLVASATGLGGAEPPHSLIALPLLPLALTAVLLGGLLLAAKALALITPGRDRGRRRSRLRRLRSALAGAGSSAP